ncbi:unnamed protein product [Closterium sp. Naga37s-1]|nr:unnamed protein product [Closterium sp. Naga37s-1]
MPDLLLPPPYSPTQPLWCRRLALLAGSLLAGSLLAVSLLAGSLLAVTLLAVALLAESLLAVLRVRLLASLWIAYDLERAVAEQ